MSLSMVQGVALPAKANVSVQQGQKRGLKASPRAVVCRASAQSIGERESKAMLASAALAGAMLVVQVPACHAAAYPELFKDTVIVEEPEPVVPEPVAEVLAKVLPAPPVAPAEEASPPAPLIGSESASGGNPAILGGLVLVSLAGAGAYASQSKEEAKEAAAPPPEPEAFDPAAAEARAGEAALWIARWRNEQDIKRRVAEASAWIASWREAAAIREREARVAERAAWIANWRSMQSSAEEEVDLDDVKVPFLTKMVKNVISVFS